MVLRGVKNNRTTYSLLRMIYFLRLPATRVFGGTEDGSRIKTSKKGKRLKLKSYAT